MKIRFEALAVLALTAGIAVAQEQTGTLKFRASKDFSFVLPTEVWSKAQGGIHVGAKFNTRKDGVKLLVDTGLDGKFRGVVKGVKGFLKFDAKVDGKDIEYAARFKGANGTYEWASACWMTVKVGDVSVTLFDLNNNGSFNEVGVDAMIVGNGKAASFVSNVVSHGGKLYQFEANATGSEAKIRPYEGDAGTLSLSGGFQGKGKLVSAVVSDGNGNSFNLAGSKSGILVPTGDYTIVGGLVQKGSHVARIREGKMSAIKVRTEATSKCSWGGPLLAEFDHAFAAGKVSVEPGAMRYYGRAGEEYYGFAPNAKSPKFKVVDPDSGREVASFIFGSCWGGSFTTGSVGVDSVTNPDVVCTLDTSLFGKVKGKSGEDCKNPNAQGGE